MIFNPVAQSGGGGNPTWVDGELTGQSSGKTLTYSLEIPKPETWTSLTVIFDRLVLLDVCAFMATFNGGETYKSEVEGGIGSPAFIESSNSLTARLLIMDGPAVIGVKYLLI